MNVEFSTVEKIEEIVMNIEQFNRELKLEHPICRKLSQFKHWYYSKELNLFGPSKFIGYKEMNASKYEAYIKFIDFDGRNTEAALKKWVNPTNDNELNILAKELRELLSYYGKNPNVRFQIHVLKS